MSTPESLATKSVVVIGVGAVGSQLAAGLAHEGVGGFSLIDHGILETNNLHRHALGRDYLGENKAAGMKKYLETEIPGTRCQALSRAVDHSISDHVLDAILDTADVIVGATDDRETQRRIGRRALSLDIPAIFPGLYERGGGEVFVQRSPRHPCFLCWDGHRPANRTLRGVAAGNADILAIIQLATWLALALLQPRSDHARDLFAMDIGEAQPPQLFIQNNLTLARLAVPWWEDCPSCRVGPAPRRVAEGEVWPERPPRHARNPPRHSLWPFPSQFHPARPLRDRVRVDALAISVVLVGVAALIAIIAVIVSSTSHHTASADVSHPYSIHVDYGQSLSEMLAASNTNQGEAHITEQQFPITKGPSAVDAILVRLTHLEVNPDVAAGVGEDPSEYTHWLTALHKLGLRPATLPELLAFSAQHPEAESNLDVVELGTLSPEKNGGLEYIVDRDGSLAVSSTSEDGFDELGYQYRFLAVHG